jgi:hypothetical protein
MPTPSVVLLLQKLKRHVAVACACKRVHHNTLLGPRGLKHGRDHGGPLSPGAAAVGVARRYTHTYTDRRTRTHTHMHAHGMKYAVTGVRHHRSACLCLRAYGELITSLRDGGEACRGDPAALGPLCNLVEHGVVARDAAAGRARRHQRAPRDDPKPGYRPLPGRACRARRPSLARAA